MTGLWVDAGTAIDTTDGVTLKFDPAKAGNQYSAYYGYEYYRYRTDEREAA